MIVTLDDLLAELRRNPLVVRLSEKEREEIVTRVVDRLEERLEPRDQAAEAGPRRRGKRSRYFGTRG